MTGASEALPAHFRLRPLTAADFVSVATWYGQIEDLSMFDRQSPVPLSVEALETVWRKSIDDEDPRASYWFAICDADDRPVGLAGIQGIHYVHGDGVLAIMAAPGVRRRGIGIRAGVLVLDMAFDQLRLSRVTSYCRADNDPSRALIRQLGFQEEGRMRRSWFSHGQHHDLIVVGQLQEEWKRSRRELVEGLGANVVVSIGEDRDGRWTCPASGNAG